MIKWTVWTDGHPILNGQRLFVVIRNGQMNDDCPRVYCQEAAINIARLLNADARRQHTKRKTRKVKR